MGVRGLETYLEQYSEACYNVDIERLAVEYRRDTKKAPVLVVDGMSILRFLYNPLNWLNGGQFKAYIERVEHFVNRFKNIGVELVFFFDGPSVERKKPIWVKRRMGDMESVLTICNELNRGKPVKEIDIRRYCCLPSNLVLFTMYLLKSQGCKTYLTTRECDEEIAEYAKKNSCFGILGQDTDFVIYKGGRYYLSMKGFDMETMTTKNYDRCKLAQSLSLKTSQLPLLASLVGNDVVPQEDLTKFHQRLCRTGKWRIPYHERIERVGEFIRGSRYLGENLFDALPRLATSVFNDESKHLLLWESITSYYPSAENREEAVVEGEWGRILVRAKELHKECELPSSVYGILSASRFQAATCLEDYRPDRELPTSGQFLKPLRQRLYGILLKEKPLEEDGRYNLVKEMVMTGAESLQSDVVVPAIPLKSEHPGLLELWRGGGSREEGWGLLLEAADLGRPPPPHLHPRLSLPLLAAAYLHRRGVGVREYEVEALLVTAVLVEGYTGAGLCRLPADPLTVRGMTLFTLFGRLISTLIMINSSCGYPVPQQYTMPHLYTDGQLFHYKLNLAKMNTAHLELCDNSDSNLELFRETRSFVFGERM